MTEAAVPAQTPVAQGDASDPLVLARRIAALAGERRASDAVLLDVRSLVDYTDFFLIVSGQSSRQNLAIAEHIVKTLKGEKRYALSKSGLDSGSWVCLDLGSIVVHVFDPETRARYDLELLWADAPRVDVAPVAPVSTSAAVTSSSASEPAASPEGAPKRRRRTVRTAAVEDADAANAPDSERPPPDEPEPEPAGEKKAPIAAPRRRKAAASPSGSAAAASPARERKATRSKASETATPAPSGAPPPARKKPSRSPRARKRGDSAE